LRDAAGRRLRQAHQLPEASMIKWAIIFAVIALVAGALGFSGVAGTAMGIAKVLFWIAVIVAVILFVLGMTVYKTLK
jgi:uncharacterized membrane protein YtjA (UPF0391 family)